MKVTPEIESLRPYVPGKTASEAMREYGLERVCKLASNENPLGPSPKAVKAMTAALQEAHRYPESNSPELRGALGQYLNVSPEHIGFGNGSNEIIDLLIRIFCEPGDQVLTAKSAFIAFKICSQAARVKCHEVALTEDLKIDADAMVKALAEIKPKMLYIPNPNNPTGTAIGEAAMKKILSAAQQLDGCLVLVDEAYAEFVRPDEMDVGETYPDMMKLKDEFSNVVVLRTFSKVFGLAGMRFGSLICGEKSLAVLDYYHRVRNPFNVNLVAQAGVMAALTDQEFLQKTQEVTWAGLDYFYQEFDRLGLKYWRSQGNFVLFDTGRDGAEVAEQLLRRGIILRPVGGYGFPSCLRLSVGLPEENQVAIQGLEKVLI